MKKQPTPEELEKQRRLSKKILKYFVLPAFAVLFFFITIGLIFAEPEKKVPEKPLTKEQIEKNTKDSLKAVREEKLDKALTVLKMQLKETMKDPSSFEMMNRTWDSKDSLKDVVKLQIKFRGNNSFGGKTVSVCNGTYNFKTDQVKISEVFTL